MSTHIYTYLHKMAGGLRGQGGPTGKADTPNLPTNIIPTKVAGRKLCGKSPTDMRIPPLRIKIMLESKTLWHP